MDLSDTFLVYLGLALAIPIGTLLLLNWFFRKRGGIAKGWAGAVFIGICWCVAIALILFKASGKA